MSGAAQGSSNTTKAVTSDSKDTSQPLQPQKPAAQLEEDDEFEDFPVEGMRACEHTLKTISNP
jgi:26 proteasome complex subunit DSS1